MTKPLTPCCYYPTTLVLVDDTKKFLHNLQLALSTKYLCESYQNPLDALTALKKKTYLDSVSANWVKTLTDDEVDLDAAGTKTLSIDFALIRKQLYNPNRFSETAVTLVDYAMPSMDGLAFCRNLKNHPLKKIMVTGEADFALAVNAFNEGIIDKFIRKDEENFFEIIEKAISELEMNYFLTITQPVIKNLAFTKNFSGSDPEIKKLFDRILVEKNIIEYYLLDDFGSYLMLDDDANPTWFIIKPESEIDKYLDIAKDNNAPNEIILSLTEKSKIPFFLTSNDEAMPVESWHEYLHPAKPLQTKCNQYYFALVSTPTVYDLNRSIIKSYKEIAFS